MVMVKEGRGMKKMFQNGLLFDFGLSDLLLCFLKRMKIKEKIIKAEIYIPWGISIFNYFISFICTVYPLTISLTTCTCVQNPVYLRVEL